MTRCGRISQQCKKPLSEAGGLNIEIAKLSRYIGTRHSDRDGLDWKFRI